MPHTELTMNTHCCIRPYTRDIEQRSKTSPGSVMKLTYNLHSSLTCSGKRPPQEQTPPCRHIAWHLQKKAPLSRAVGLGQRTHVPNSVRVNFSPPLSCGQDSLCITNSRANKSSALSSLCLVSQAIRMRMLPGAPGWLRH